MSGFFAVRTGSLEVDVLRPLGYKILLEWSSATGLAT